MEYCRFCGTQLVPRELKNEGMVPYCEKCGEFRFPVFSTAVSMIVMNRRRDRILLIKQYGRDSYILVAGYVNKGEDAENTVRREVAEETGLRVVELHFNAVKADKGDGKVKGVECWVPTEAADTKLAKALCAAVQSLGFTNRGVKRKNFSVIYTAHKAGVPALLLELCFLDDADDMALYDPHKAAAAIAEALTEHFGLHTDPAWAWCAERGLVSGAADAAITAGALARALYKLHGGEK